MLKRIYADNYKCFVNFELKLDELVVLLGRNGAGKSSLLDGLSALRNLLSGKPRLIDPDAFPAETLTQWETRNVQVFELDVDIRETGSLTYRLEIEHQPAQERARILLERLAAPEGPLFEFNRGTVQLYRDDHSRGPSFAGDWSQSWLARFTGHRDNPRPARFLDWMSRLVICGVHPPSMGAESRTEETVLNRDGSNFSGWYRSMIQERPDRTQALTKALSDVVGGFKGLRLEKVGKDARVLKASFDFDHDGGYELPFDRLSDGQRALVFLYAILYMNRGNGYTLLLDEPDNYVALAEIQPWLMALSDRIGDDIHQAIMCSHHPEVIDYLGYEHGILLDRTDAGPVTARRAADLNLDGTLRLSEVIARGWETS
jgi:predicted ATPase